MSEFQENPEKSPYKKVIRVKPGDTFSLRTKNGFSSAIIGRDVEDFGRSGDVKIPEDCLGVNLENTTNNDTSRLQMKIRRNSVGNYYVKNLSESIPLFTVSRLRGEQEIKPLRHIVIGDEIAGFEGLGIDWYMNTKSMNSIQTIDTKSKGDDWEVKFTYSRKPLS